MRITMSAPPRRSQIGEAVFDANYTMATKPPAGRSRNRSGTRRSRRSGALRRTDGFDRASDRT